MQTLPFSLKDYPFRKANVLAWDRYARRPRLRLVLRLILYAVFGLALVWGTSALGQPDWVTYSLAGNLIVLVNMASDRLAATRVSTALRTVPMYAGLPVITLTDTDLRFSGQDGECVIRWNGLRDLIPGPGGWIICLTGNAYLPLPAAAFASPAEAEAFITALRARIPTVKDPF